VCSRIRRREKSSLRMRRIRVAGNAVLLPALIALFNCDKLAMTFSPKTN